MSNKGYFQPPAHEKGPWLQMYASSFELVPRKTLRTPLVMKDVTEVGDKVAFESLYHCTYSVRCYPTGVLSLGESIRKG